MDHDVPAAPRPEDAFALLLRRCLLVVGPLGAVCAVVAGLVAGGRSALSAAVGALIVIAFFGARLVVMRQMATKNPQLVLITALLVYTVKIVLLGVAMLVLTRVPAIDGRSLGLTVLAAAAVWLAVEMITTMRLRVPIFGLDTGADPRRGESGS